MALALFAILLYLALAIVALIHPRQDKDYIYYDHTGMPARVLHR